MLQTRTNELENYVKRIGEHINAIHASINEVNRKLKEIENSIADLKTGTANNSNAALDLKENMVPKQEFDEFVNRLTESLKALLPPTSGTEED